MFINDTLDSSFYGNTGTSVNINSINVYGSSNTSNISAMSDIVIQNIGRIGDVRVASVSTVAIGDQNNFNAIGVVGNYAHN